MNLLSKRKNQIKLAKIYKNIISSNNILTKLFILLFFLFISCNDSTKSEKEDINYRQEMRDFVTEISTFCKNIDSDFIIIPQNGTEIITTNGGHSGTSNLNYLNAIDGIGQESLNYGYSSDNKSTPQDEYNWTNGFLKIAQNQGIRILVTDYCYSHDKMDLSYQNNKNNSYISFAADHRELNNIPDYPDIPNNENANDINSLSDAMNFLYLINPDQFVSKREFISSVCETNYDVIIMDFFFHNDEFSIDEIEQLKLKNNGGKRIVISYISIGEAEDYRYYWLDSWKNNKPDWIDKENPDWEGNYKVKYWNAEWKEIVFGNQDSYISKIINKNFDGIYLDIIDAFEYFE